MKYTKQKNNGSREIERERERKRKRERERENERKKERERKRERTRAREAGQKRRTLLLIDAGSRSGPQGCEALVLRCECEELQEAQHETREIERQVVRRGEVAHVRRATHESGGGGGGVGRVGSGAEAERRAETRGVDV